MQKRKLKIIEPISEHVAYQADLSEDYTDIWIGSLNVKETELEFLRKSLSIDELKRADKFVFDKHRRRFIAGRFFLRNILCRYLDMLPADIEFSYGKWGKPEISGNNSNICFNMSNSKETAIFAVSSGVCVGIDIEFIRPISEVESIAEGFFSKKEYKMILDCPTWQKSKLFFDIWSLKEAYLKAIGKGLSGMEDVEVKFNCEQNPYILYKSKVIDQNLWNVRKLNPKPEFSGAAAVKFFRVISLLT